MSSDLKFPKKDAVVKLRALYTKLTKRPLTPEKRQLVLDVFKKKEKQPQKNESGKPKKIAKPNQDAGLL